MRWVIAIMKESNAILNIHFNENTWKPPILDEASLVLEAKNAPIASQSDEYFYIFQVTPYIDSLYIRFGSDEKVIETRKQISGG